MSYQKVYRGLDDATVEARQRSMKNIQTGITSTPSTAWLDKLRERQEAGEILMPTQLEMLRRVGT